MISDGTLAKDGASKILLQKDERRLRAELC
jgi:hypothetical protein